MKSFKARNCFVSLIPSHFYWRTPLGLGFSLIPSHSFSFSGLSTNTFMDVVKATLKRASTAYDSVAVRAENNSYSYAQIVSSAWSICNHLCNGNFKSNIEECKYETSVQTNNKSKNLHGARIGIVAKPSAEFLAGVLGTWLSGGVAVPLALSYPEIELLHVMNDSVEEAQFIIRTSFLI